MSTISSVGSAGSAWADLASTQASARNDRMFAKADANGDGKVDQTELQSLLDDISSPTGQSLGSADDLLSKMDSDNSGSLSEDELADGMKNLMPPPSSTMDFAQQRSADGQMPPPPPPDDAVSSASSSTRTSTSASATELAASQFRELITNLSPALDDIDGAQSSSNGTGGLDLSALAQRVMKEYAQASSNHAQPSSLSLAA